MEFRILGSVEVSGESGTVPMAGKTAALVGVLALQAPRPVEKQRLHEIIWAGQGGLNVVEGKIRVVRSKLALGANEVIVTRGSAYGLEADTDVQRFHDLVRLADSRAGAELRGAAEAYTEALELWRGDVLPDLTDQLVRSEITALEHQRRAAHLSRLRTLLVLGAHGEVLGAADQLLVEDPYWEEVLRIKVRALYQTQGGHAASALMRQFSESLAQQGLDPSPEWNVLARQVLNHELPVVPSVAASAGARPSEPAPETHTGAVPPLDNIPPAAYARFVMRPRPWARLEEAVEQALPVISLIGIGGSGKSTLAREFTVRQLREGARFRSGVWVSDREQAGTTTLTTLLDTVALTLDYPGLVALDFDRKKLQVRRLLRRTPVLLVVDNHETIEDRAIDEWLITVPEPSKVLVTSITHAGTLAPHSFQVEVAGLNEDEARDFYAQCLNRLGLQDLLAKREELDELRSVAQGNPRLIEWGIGQVKRRGRTIAEVAEEISNAPSSDRSGDVVLRDLFRESWTSLTGSARRVLGALACFPYGTDRDTLRRVSGCGDGLEDALAELTDYCFVSRQEGSDTASTRYLAYPLAVNRRSLLPVAEMAAIRDRWLRYYVDLTAAVGFCPDDVSRLRRLDVPGLRRNLEYALTWAAETGRRRELIDISREARYYYYVRGLWATQPNVHLMRADAARRIGDDNEEFDALVYHLNISAKQENQDGTQEILTRLEAILSDGSGGIGERQLGEYRHARALHLLAQNRLSEAEEQWRANLTDPAALGPANYSANLRWLAICLARTGTRNEEALTLFAQAREHARHHGYRRAELLIDLQVAELRLSMDAGTAAAHEVLCDLAERTEPIASIADRRYQADLHWLLGESHHRLGEYRSASKVLRIAAELYSKLGLADRAARARALDATCATPSRRQS
ncbi:AfsR/SARP family transcriptional regulator [Streptomyces sp. WMMC940]|uniref:AfsR/SARP family transcriptional regulator n=1 Tax=Streptomyces sp. WMMC940 TaxID=3015153 RepID=UPI0022B72B34|nr:BTAD domain-containing putative transcriptional regulator [Streptomyces sp. WMMC940]MCZ7457344.1 BTAD domain-containing putative transcriptional regulator [Streptomyces sp. WMMC940]